MQLEDDNSLQEIEDQESRDPSVPIITTHGATPVYRSRQTKAQLSGLPVLADFGQMRLAEGQTNQNWWMSDLYRAPEVFLGLPWEYPVDVWSIGVMVSTTSAKVHSVITCLTQVQNNWHLSS